ncbi:MAG: tetratricopeptide repeat protein [Planctomycetales bacterium]|nr:tetratricopeptide repeat protein [Planctomycetales bacterium]
MRYSSVILTMMIVVSAVALSADVQSLEQHYQAARAALVRSDTAKAERELKLSIQDNPLHSDSHFLLALLLWQKGDFDQAIAAFQQTTKLDSNNAAARYNLGTAMLWRGEPISAALQFEEAILIRPDHVPSYNNLAKAYFLAGLPELAVAGYKEALSRDPSNAVALRNLAVFAAAAGDQKVPGADDAKKPAITPEVQGVKELALSDAEQEIRDEVKADALREILCDLPYVTVERRAERLALGGWTRDARERKMLDAILVGHSDVLDMTTDDAGDSHRLLEIDAIIFRVIGLDSESTGHNFLRNVQVTAEYLAQESRPQTEWLFSAAIDYQVNIANVAQERIAFLARPHLTTLSGSPATFIAGGDIVFKVSGTTSGDIKPYPFGTTLEVTPTLLRTRDEDGGPLVRLTVKAGRRSVLPPESLEMQASGDSVAFSNLEVTSEAVLGLGRTLILTGLSQRESAKGSSGVPILKDIPVIQYFFSNKSTRTSDSSVIILLTPRDPAYWDEQNQKANAAFIDKRRAFVEALQGTEEDMRQFKRTLSGLVQAGTKPFSHPLLPDGELRALPKNKRS